MLLIAGSIMSLMTSQAANWSEADNMATDNLVLTSLLVYYP